MYIFARFYESNLSAIQFRVFITGSLSEMKTKFVVFQARVAFSFIHRPSDCHCDPFPGIQIREILFVFGLVFVPS